MKSLKLLLLATIAVCFFTACDDTQNPIIEDSLTEINAKTSKQKEVPFKGKLFTGQADDAFSEICSATSPTDFWGLDHQVGYGNATHVGNFNIDLMFCFHVVLNEHGFPDFEGGFGEYSGDEPVSLEASNGDLLTLDNPDGGRLIPVQSEVYRFEFEDTWHIIGGTGRFENASGEFVWHGKVRIDDTGTDHSWEGTIILDKES
ncbi:hypothetical protein [Seonamhaeicola aphaedonensis]|uniref:Lipoprotein n=1 Tax=Seonamhaeicola aphaedonensis TaxID=1461338 RepID=A0A3D9H5F1_9FLAO|nr:hypothetical protein [Seonamhaeicola aphaedonensis]RED44733.1 hypothetical protein DFQ02_11036 [Seonamhaeicola aphaedonensis]